MSWLCAASVVSGYVVETVLSHVHLLVAIQNAVLVAVDPDPLAGPGRDAGERHGLVEQGCNGHHGRLVEWAPGLPVRAELVGAEIEEPELFLEDTGLRHEIALAHLGARDEEIEAPERRREVLVRDR